MYKIYQDKEKIFECTVDVKGANITDTVARLIFEGDKGSSTFYMIPGSIDNSGNCLIKIPKLKNLKEGSTGKIFLEIIAENTLFTAWSSDYQIDVSKSVNVSVNEDTSSKNENTKENNLAVNVAFKNEDERIEESIDEDSGGFESFVNFIKKHKL